MPKTLEQTQIEYNLLAACAKQIAMLPLEDMIAALDRAETVCPILDPTLFKNYLDSRRGPLIKKLMQSALVLKNALLEMQPTIAEMIGEE